jgi:integrase/recombinase XerD
MQRPDASLIDEFIDALWLADGLSKNTLASYRSDLALFSAWLGKGNNSIVGADEAAINGYLAFLHARPGGIKSERFPKTLSEKQVEALLAAPDCDTPLGLRDRAMLEVLYATGLRVSELVGAETLRGQPQRRRGARDGQGREGAPGAARSGGAGLDRERYLKEARPQLLDARSCDAVFVTARGGAMTRQMFWHADQALRRARRHPHPARISPHTLRHAFATHLTQPRRRPARRAAAARPRRHFDDPGLHPRRPRTAERRRSAGGQLSQPSEV